MKVLHIIDSLGLGGAQSVVKGIFEIQINNKDIFLFSLRKKEIEIKINHYNILISNSLKKYSLAPIVRLRNLVEKENIDILHCHLFKSQVFGWLLKRLWFPNIDLVFHEHGEIAQKHPFYIMFLKLADKHVNLYIAVSKATKEKLVIRARVKDDKIRVLHNFVDLNKFNRHNITLDVQKERSRLGIFPEEFVIGFVGRLAKVKGCEYLIKALPHLDFPYSVLIAGEGAEKEYLEKLAYNVGVKNMVTFLGYKDDVRHVYSLIDVLVMPSLSEGSPVSLLEAQAMGIPVIASDIDSINELGTENVLFFRSQNHLDLFQKIKLLRDNPTIKKSLVANSLRIVKNSGIGDYIATLQKIYKEIK